MKVNIFWFRRDLRLEDNTALNAALENENVIPIFIFDDCILKNINKNDARLTFIHSLLESINHTLNQYNSGLISYYGNPKEVWRKIIKNYNIDTVFWNRDYEPYSVKRDNEIHKLLVLNNIKRGFFE